ncbi:hypothetical protein EDB83DRAFT_2317984 [Lactarius deliciosus]|nr:hypothetical protein EDB83DRAFT_2317984 [Lactarius deliciosus]
MLSPKPLPRSAQTAYDNSLYYDYRPTLNTAVVSLTLYRTAGALYSALKSAVEIFCVMLREGLLYYSFIQISAICTVTLAFTIVVVSADPSVRGVTAQYGSNYGTPDPHSQARQSALSTHFASSHIPQPHCCDDVTHYTPPRAFWSSARTVCNTPAPTRSAWSSSAVPGGADVERPGRGPDTHRTPVVLGRSTSAPAPFGTVYEGESFALEPCSSAACGRTMFAPVVLDDPRGRFHAAGSLRPGQALNAGHSGKRRARRGLGGYGCLPDMPYKVEQNVIQVTICISCLHIRLGLDTMADGEQQGARSPSEPRHGRDKYRSGDGALNDLRLYTATRMKTKEHRTREDDPQ